MDTREILNRLDENGSLILEQAFAVSISGALALVLVSPLSGEPSIEEIDPGQFFFRRNKIMRFETLKTGMHDVSTVVVGSDAAHAFLQVLSACRLR